MAIKVIELKCPQNHVCPSVKICPAEALKQEGHNAPTVDNEKCIDCGKCSDFCPKKALVLETED
jgi:Fe-S-cluster-containing hydrogenase component 2